MKKIKQGDFSFQGEAWRNVSQQAKELIQGTTDALLKWSIDQGWMKVVRINGLPSKWYLFCVFVCVCAGS